MCNIFTTGGTLRLVYAFIKKCLEESDIDVEEPSPSTSRRTSIASSLRTLDRRGSDDESEDDTIVIDRRKGFNDRKIENAQDSFYFFGLPTFV